MSLITEQKSDDLNSVLSTRENMNNLIDEIETLSKELILQTINSTVKIQKSSDSTTSHPNNELLQLTKLIIEKQQKLNNYIQIASEQEILHNKINKLKEALIESDSDIKSLLLYLKEAEQVLSSAVYQSRLKLNMIKKSKPLSSDLIIRYAQKISSDYGVCCPENWTPDHPHRPYPTDADMRKGWLAKLNGNEFGTNLANENSEQNEQANKNQLLKSNSRMIDPIVPHEFNFNNNLNSQNLNPNNLTEYMSDLSSDSSSDSDSNMT